jgi:peptide deformylase
MAVKRVLLLGDPELRQEAAEVTAFDEQLKEIVQDLKDTLIYLRTTKEMGRALAAPQIGYHKQVIYSQQDGEEIIMVNPQVVEKSEEMFSVWDSCFSFDLSFFVNIKRHKEVKIKYQTLDGDTKLVEFSDDMSELFQHEIDHLDGILATDHLQEENKIVIREEWESRYKSRGENSK